ncbi:MAG TPA: hypothetical protein VFB60_08360 [Ktedonobacteraceae bacterium]|nr:hypothetical protein [Ktedonobacteraceae bacterium]
MYNRVPTRCGQGHRRRAGQPQGIAPTLPIRFPIIAGTAAGQPSRLGTMMDAAGEWLGAIPRGCPARTGT